MTSASRSDFPEPVRILSDLHLGHPGSRVASAEALRPLLEGARTVILNGDTVEMRAKSFRPAADQLCGDLLALTAELGIKTHFLSGNHDNHISETHHVDLCGDKVLVTHGDVLYPEIAPWGIKNRKHLAEILAFDRKVKEEEGDAFEARLCRAKRVCEFTTIFEPDAERGVFGHLHTLADVLFPPRRIAVILGVWARQKRLAASFCSAYRPRARVMVFGHTHFPGVWNAGDRVIVNTGGFVSVGGALMAELEGAALKVYAVKRKGDRFVAAATPKRTVELGSGKGDAGAAVADLAATSHRC